MITLDLDTVRKMRVCSDLLDPPAPEVVKQLCDEVERLRKALTEIAFDTENRKREIAVKALES